MIGSIEKKTKEQYYFTTGKPEKNTDQWRLV